ncbi:MAG: ABC transporter permease [Candidatus Atribacteria bacterium]|nr:ABC transporter permease [Candidatus Atribacteria bacterium]
MKIQKRGILSIEGLPVALVFMVVILAFMKTAPNAFLRPTIYMSFLTYNAPTLVLAAGLTLIITAGEIDLSFPSVIAFSGMVFSYLFQITGMVFIPFLAAIAAGAFIGYMNGIILTKIGIPSIMTTLATNFFWTGLTILISGGISLNVNPIKGSYVDATKIKVFTLMGLLGGFAAVLLTFEMTNFWTNQGSGFLLPVMAAVFIGGTSITGGEGRVIGTLFGMFIVGSLETGVTASGVGGFWTRLTTGLIMLGSIALNIVLDKTSEKSFSFVDNIKNSVFTKGLKK